MDKVSRLPADQRRDLFQESAARLGVNTARGFHPIRTLFSPMPPKSFPIYLMNPSAR